jgi:BTB/POZ domain
MSSLHSSDVPDRCCLDSAARERCAPPGADDGEIVDVNVGGMHYATTRHTLCSAREPRSMLAAMFAGGALPSRTDRHGCVFIDRDGGRFRQILNYLRSGTVHCDADRTALGELLEEAEYFGTFMVCLSLGGDNEFISTNKRYPYRATRQKQNPWRYAKQILSLFHRTHIPM